jgi:hypothetical protein
MRSSNSIERASHYDGAVFPCIPASSKAPRALVSLFALPFLCLSAFFASTSSADEGKPFQLAPASATFEGESRSDLLERALRKRIGSSSESLNAKDCAQRPQLSKPAGLFLLPGEVNKTLTCTIDRSMSVMIDLNGAICNQSEKKKATEKCVNDRLDVIKRYDVTIDGRNLGAGRYRTISNEFVVQTKDGNAFKLQAGKWKLRAGGWPIIVSEFTPGEHTIVATYKIGDLKPQSITVTLRVT